MPDQDKTDVHKPDGIIFQGEVVGHGDKRSHIRKRDGIIFPGEEVGYVDESGNIRRPDGVILRGEAVGQVKDRNTQAKDKAAHALDGIIFSGEEWGYVDEDGNIRQRDGIIFRGRIIGKMRGKNKAAALGYFVLRFNEMENRFEKLQSESRSAQNKGAFLGKVRYMLNYVPKADALGDFDGLISRLKSLEQEILDGLNRVQGENRSKKEALISRAESLSGSTDWKTTAAALKALQQDWKAIGFAGKDYDESLWARFRAAQDSFYQRRTAFFEQRDRERVQNRAEKESLCSQAESLSSSTDWKAAGDSIKGLQAQWKQIGSAGREFDEPLWQRFRSAQDLFFERRAAFFSERNREALSRKREQASKLRESIDHDEGNISRWHATIDGLHNGGRADEIRSSLEGKISDVEDKIRSKRDRLHELERSIQDLESKLG